MLLVSKFGGSSLSCAKQFQKVKNIVLGDENRRVVVVSALGKRQVTDSKLTDLFYSVFEHVSHSTYYESLWTEIIERFVTVKDDLNLEFDVEYELRKIQNALATRNVTLDYLVSRGEYLTAKMMSEYLGYDFVDAHDLIIFDSGGEVDLESTYQRISTLATDDKRIVVPGFYGTTSSGDIKIFSRGGSDITGALLAAGLNACKYENFTDVSGVLMVDPRIVRNPRAISELTYEEMRCIAYMGAEVLHRKSVYPVQEKKIPIHIRNTNNPYAPGTLISDNPNKNESQLTGFFGRKDYTFMTLCKKRATSEPGFMWKLFALFENYKVHIEQSLTGIDQVGLLVSSVDIKYSLEHILSDLALKLEIDDVRIKEGLSLITIFGRDVINNPAFLARVFGAMHSAKIESSLFEQSPQGINLVIGVPTLKYESAIAALYEELVENDKEVAKNETA